MRRKRSSKAQSSAAVKSKMRFRLSVPADEMHKVKIIGLNQEVEEDHGSTPKK